MTTTTIITITTITTSPNERNNTGPTSPGIRNQRTKRMAEAAPTSAGGRAALAADVGHFDLGEIHGFAGTDLGIPIVARSPDAGDRAGDRVIGRITANERAKIAAGRREE